MIAKAGQYDRQTHDPRVRAGLKAEEQMQFYLHRAFATSPDLYILNDLRLEDANQPEPNGQPGVCQIDHLVIHRWGMFIVESKSVTEEVVIRSDGSGGDEWSRKHNGRELGMGSPIQQAIRQGRFLRALLQRSREQLLGKMPTGLGTISKLLSGTDQRGFGNLPIQVIVAVSDQGRITRLNGWKEPEGDHALFVCKADLVTDRINMEFTRHREGAPLLGGIQGNYGNWSMLTTEVSAVASFLSSKHTPLRKHQSDLQSTAESPSSRSLQPCESVRPATTQPESLTGRPRCKSCASADLHVISGKYGYYWKCGACQANTAMPTVCDACGAAGRGPSKVRIRKDGPNYWRECALCNMSEKVWVQQ